MCIQKKIPSKEERAIMEPEPLDISFLDVPLWIQSRNAKTTLQHLILIANRYLNWQKLAKRHTQFWTKICPVLICLVFCCEKNMAEFQKRWSVAFNPEMFQQRSCPRDLKSTRCGYFSGCSHALINIERTVDSYGRIDFPGRHVIRYANTVS
jgi:hypothetical protein